MIDASFRVLSSRNVDLQSEMKIGWRHPRIWGEVESALGDSTKDGIAGCPQHEAKCPSSKVNVDCFGFKIRGKLV